MNRIILIAAMLIPFLLFSQNRAPEQKRPQGPVENKTERYEYVIVRAMMDVESMPKAEQVISPKKKGKKNDIDEDESSKNNVKGQLKTMQKARWAITFDFGRVKSKESQMVARQQFFHLVDALNYLGSRGFELSVSEIHETDQGSMQVYYMRKSR